MEEYTRFRGTLGGFNRKDVCSWIESSAKEQQQTIQSLQQELTRLNRENEQLRQESLLLHAELTDYEELSLQESRRDRDQEQAEREHSLAMDEARALCAQLETDCAQARELLTRLDTAGRTAAQEQQEEMDRLSQVLDQLTRRLGQIRESFFDPVPLPAEESDTE